MKTKLITTIITSLFIANAAFAEYSYVDSNDFTGESFFQSPTLETSKKPEKGLSRTPTTPPLKKARLMIQDKVQTRKDNMSQFAPTNPDASIYKTETDTSEYASKEVKEEFDENMMPDGFEADEESIEENKKARRLFGKNSKQDFAQDSENTEDIILDCENVDYDTNNYCIYAKGNVNVEFVKQGTVVKADVITYDRMNNTIKAEGNVRILKNGQTITGDYIFVDMNEENALIENPTAKTGSIAIHSQKGYVYGDKIVQENGELTVEGDFPINFGSKSRGPKTSSMLLPKNQTITEDMEKGLIYVDLKELKITQKGDLETIRIKRANIHKGKHTILKIPALKIYTNKNHDYAETNCWEIGTLRGLGLYAGPGFVFELPKGSVLKAIPMLNYKSGFGVGAVGRFHSGTNTTQAAYGTAASKILIHGRQDLDDNLYLEYGMNDYLHEWFLGRRRAKYGIGLVYDKGYASEGFLLKDRMSSFRHRIDLGYYQDSDYDNHFRKLSGSLIGTTRARYMAEASQNLYKHINKDKQTALSFDIASQLSAALYGTGDTQIIGRIGPRMHMQYKRWMQDIGYFQSVYDDNTPMPVFDAYRYGKSNVYLREYFRICKYLTLCWFGSMNLSNDSPNDRTFQENSFYFSLGPDDFKVNLGYDTVRENTFFSFEVMMNAKGTKVSYDKLEIKQDKKAQKDEKPKEEKKSDFQNSEKAPVLQRAVVEDIKTVEDVL
ncbi:LPS-assembly protein LptD [bacterium]|nr:LPS-assembly protein LptD [bacterium]